MITAEGHRVIFDREIPFHIRFQDKNIQTQDLPNLEALKVRVMLLGEDKNPVQVRIELSSDNDLFFHFTHNANDASFKLAKQQQGLNIDFHEYPAICIKSLNKCENDSAQYAAIFTILTEGEGKLEIVQTTEYKNIEIINFDFNTSPEELIRQVISYKYVSQKQKLSLMEGRMTDINEIIRLKNPSLLLQIQKSQAQTVKSTLAKKK